MPLNLGTGPHPGVCPFPAAGEATYNTRTNQVSADLLETQENPTKQPGNLVGGPKELSSRAHRSHCHGPGQRQVLGGLCEASQTSSAHLRYRPFLCPQHLKQPGTRLHLKQAGQELAGKQGAGGLSVLWLRAGRVAGAVGKGEEGAWPPRVTRERGWMVTDTRLGSRPRPDSKGLVTDIRARDEGFKGSSQKPERSANPQSRLSHAPVFAAFLPSSGSHCPHLQPWRSGELVGAPVSGSCSSDGTVS